MLTHSHRILSAPLSRIMCSKSQGQETVSPQNRRWEFPDGFYYLVLTQQVSNERLRAHAVTAVSTHSYSWRSWRRAPWVGIHRFTSRLAPVEAASQSSNSSRFLSTSLEATRNDGPTVARGRGVASLTECYPKRNARCQMLLHVRKILVEVVPAAGFTRR